jgi:hypothetical protein
LKFHSTNFMLLWVIIYTIVTSESHFLSKATTHLVQDSGITDHTRTSYVYIASGMEGNQVGWIRKLNGIGYTNFFGIKNRIAPSCCCLTTDRIQFMRNQNTFLLRRLYIPERGGKIFPLLTPHNIACNTTYNFPATVQQPRLIHSDVNFIRHKFIRLWNLLRVLRNFPVGIIPPVFRTHNLIHRHRR